MFVLQHLQINKLLNIEEISIETETVQVPNDGNIMEHSQQGDRLRARHSTFVEPRASSQLLGF
jgi:hypothetical protein